MTRANPEIETISAVLLGNFNPSIFQPAWLAHHGLIREAESQEAEIQIIRPEITVFQVGPFLLHADLQRFKLEISDPGRSAALRDLVTGIFGILGETPLQGFGINRSMHFRLASVEEWNRVGDRLAPKDVYDGLLDSPGLRVLTLWGSRDDGSSERIQLQVEPSARVEPGIYLAVNEHFEADAEESTSDLLETLEREWDASQRYALEVVQTLLERTREA